MHDDAPQQPDPQPGAYYVSAIEGAKHWLMSGPYPKHSEALAKVDPVRNLCCDLDARAHWKAFGTCRYPEGHEKPGALQKAGYDLELVKAAA